MGMTNDQDLSATPTYSPHQLAYFAHQLTRRAAADSMDRMAGALLDAQVDLNPHQIDAALFATSNPLSKGAILATRPNKRGWRVSTPAPLLRAGY